MFSQRAGGINKGLVLVFFVVCGFIVCSAAAGPAKPVVTDAVRDVFTGADYGNEPFEGYLGTRMRINLQKRLLKLNIDSILEPFIHRPSVQLWAGEHVGKFLHAACYAWKYGGDENIKKRIDDTVRRLISTQLPDGYLGTYLDKDRWTGWDVWTHKYNMIGLLTYYKMTGYEPALQACRKMGDLLCNTFGPGKRDIIKSGEHVGMAATSVLEPMVDLYRYTGEKRYLDFCEYIVKSWDQPNGPKILRALLRRNGNVYKTANGKAYEMLSNLAGLLELYRMTGKADYLRACELAWQDIMTYRHYIIGTTSWGEFFKGDYDLRPDGAYYWGDIYSGPSEGCVTVTWEQFNRQLLRLSGDAKYADELERIVYNALLGAQSPRNGSVCYFVPLVGRKRYGEVNHGIKPDICCCSSSVPRGIALIPEFMAGAINGKAAVILYNPAEHRLTVQGTQGRLGVTIKVEGDYPAEPNVSLTIRPDRQDEFTLLLLVPKWCTNFTAQLAGRDYHGNAGTFLGLKYRFKNEQKVLVQMEMPFVVVDAGKRNPDKVMAQRGPQVLAADENFPHLSKLPDNWIGEQLYIFEADSNNRHVRLAMVPFADAGQTLADYNVLADKSVFDVPGGKWRSIRKKPQGK